MFYTKKVGALLSKPRVYLVTFPFSVVGIASMAALDEAVLSHLVDVVWKAYRSQERITPWYMF